MKQISLKKRSDEGYKCQTLKNVFHEKIAVGESLLTLVAEHGAEKP
jgi:hypothetical protein